MKTQKALLFVSALVTITILSCKKEKDVTPTTPPGSSNISTFFQQNAAQKQTFTINANQYQSISGTKGTILQFQPGSFKNSSGPVTSGTITVELREMYSKADMIMSNAPTMSNNQLLVSGGELFLQAFQNGTPLSLSSSNSVSVQMPTNTNALPMNEFYSNQEFTSGADLDWNLADSSTNDSIIVINDSIDFESPSYYYYFYLDGLNWINCDHFWDSPGPFTDVDVNVGTQFNMANCAVYISFDGMNSITSLGDYDANHIFNYGYQSFPQGLNIHIIALAKINGQLYSGIIPGTLTANFSTNITLMPTTLTQFTSAVNLLP